PASGFVGPLAAIAIGVGAGVFCYLAVRFRTRRNLDDSLDVWGVHGIGGTWGALATGLFATTAINAAGGNGLFSGNPAQLGIQALAVAIVWVYAFVMTWVILKVLDAIMGVRVSPVEELIGLDLSQHSEAGYRL
ncbi:MAG TPA: ammonia channel protein, partial [Dehalococcoidia bacterium]|nr:ammonia channel protein [Dehalococcoidia bacterium]